MGTSLTSTSASGSGRQPVREPPMWSVVAPLLWPFRWRLALALLMNGLHGLAITYQLLILPMLLGILTAEIEPDEKLRRAIWLAISYVVVSIFGRMLMWHLGYRIFTWCREQMIVQLRGQFYRHVNHLCLRFHNRHPSGELQSYLFGTPLGQVVNFYQHVSIHVAGSIFTIVSTLIVLGAWDWALSCVLFAAAIATVIVMQFAFRRVKKISAEYMQAEGGVSGHIADLLRGNKAVKLHAMEERVAVDFDRHAQELARRGYDRDVRSHVEWMKHEVVSYVALGALVVVAVWRLNDHHITMAAATAYIICYQGLTGPLQALFQGVTLWGQAQAALRRIGAVLDTASTTPEPVGTERPAPERGDIVLDQVCFAYEPGNDILRGLSLTIPYGQKVAIVGPSGSGKTTIIQLLLRLYDPRQGSVSIAGTDLRNVRSQDLRRRFGVVPQDPFIFRASLRENLLITKPNATQADMEQALRLANAWDFVAKLPQRLDTVVGEGGSTLSGGQRQRLAIARALLAEPPFFIFDEATSALDTVSEGLIQQVLERNLGGRTAIFIAHRLATVQHCDRILVLADGGVVQDGTYRDLVDQPGLFRELVSGQQLRA